MSRRGLTDGEIALARSIFGQSIDYGAVRIHDRGFAGLGGMGDMSYGGHIYLPHRHAPDFARAPLSARRLFVHELVHVWQHQNRVLALGRSALREWVRHRFSYARAYLFRLDPACDLLDYGIEQQPAIIEEYFLRRHGGTPMGRCLNDVADVPALLAIVLENFLRDPSYARRRPARRRSAPRLRTLSSGMAAEMTHWHREPRPAP